MYVGRGINKSTKRRIKIVVVEKMTVGEAFADFMTEILRVGGNSVNYAFF
jgi:hypothetical protein